MNILDLLLKTSVLIKINMLILILFSITSWVIILQRIRVLNSATHEVKIFKKKFWSGIGLSSLYQESQKHRNRIFGIELIFYNGFKEFVKISRINNFKPKFVVEGVHRAMNIAMNREIEALEVYIPFLGTIGSISPYIGLFGTICGIMHAFFAIGAVKQVTLQTIAPSIAESLVATATGLLSAIPAVIAYNYLNQRINKIEMNYDNFMEEFIIILYHHIFVNTENSKG